MQDKFNGLMDDLMAQFDFQNSYLNLADLLDFGLFLARRYAVVPVYPFPLIYSSIQEQIALTTISNLVQESQWNLEQFEKFLLRSQQLYINQISNWQRLAGPNDQQLAHLISDAAIRFLPLQPIQIADKLTFQPQPNEQFFDVERVSWYQNSEVIRDFDSRVQNPLEVSIMASLGNRLNVYSPEGVLTVSNQRLVHQYRDDNDQPVLKQLALSKVSEVKTYKDAVLLWVNHLPLVMRTTSPRELSAFIQRLIDRSATLTRVRNGLVIHNGTVVLSTTAKGQVYQQVHDQLIAFTKDRFDLQIEPDHNVVSIVLKVKTQKEANRLHSLVTTKNAGEWNQSLVVPLLKNIYVLSFIGYDVNLLVEDGLTPNGPYTLLEMLYGHLIVNLGIGLVHKIHQFRANKLITDIEVGLVDRKSLQYFD